MGFISDLFASKSNQKQKNTTTGRNTSNAVSRQNENFWDRVTGRNQQTASRGSDYSKAMIDTALKTLGNNYLNFTPERAAVDSRAAVDATLARVLNLGMGDIQQGATIAGGYNSTATKLLEDNLRAQAAAAGAEIELNTRNQYAQNQSNIAADVAKFVQLSQSSLEDIMDTTDQAQESASIAGNETTENTDYTEDQIGIGSGKNSKGVGGIVLDVVSAFSGGN